MGFDPADDGEQPFDRERRFDGKQPFEGRSSGGDPSPGEDPSPDEDPSPGERADAQGAAQTADDVPVAVPDELDHMPPGPLLAEILDDVPVEQVSGFDSMVVLAAAYRQLCRQQAVFYRALVETGLRAEKSASTVVRLSAPESSPPRRRGRSLSGRGSDPGASTSSGSI
jgi:hypothetical protein